MTFFLRIAAAVALILVLAFPVMGRQYLYTPQPVPDGQKATVTDGVLVREVSVKKGDTLFDLSRTYSGHGMYYPQILLFNSIKNPRLIYPGAVLRVPVAHSRLNETDAADTAAVPATPHQPQSADEPRPPAADNTAAPAVRPHQTETGSDRRHKKKTSRAAAKATARKTVSVTTPAAKTSAGQKLYESAIKAYRQNEFNSALDLFDRFLSENAGSPLAADAALYKADCYMKLSAP